MSLIRTCQELVFSNSTSRELGFEISKAMLIVFEMFSKELDLKLLRLSRAVVRQIITVGTP